MILAWFSAARDPQFITFFLILPRNSTVLLFSLVLVLRSTSTPWIRHLGCSSPPNLLTTVEDLCFFLGDFVFSVVCLFFVFCYLFLFLVWLYCQKPITVDNSLLIQLLLFLFLHLLFVFSVLCSFSFLNKVCGLSTLINIYIYISPLGYYGGGDNFNIFVYHLLNIHIL